MSFSQEQKNDIKEQGFKSLCCRRAFIQGVLFAKAEESDGQITVCSDSLASAEYICEFIKEIYSKQADILSPPKGGRVKHIRFSSPAVSKYLASISNGLEPFSEKCAYCQSAFLKGIFFASGRVSDPYKQYSLEFCPKNTELFCKMLENCAFVPRVSQKKHETLVYFRNTTQIEDFFALAGMNNTAFCFMNAKIQAEIRNNVNRIANCETNNIDKAVSASLSQIGLIEALVERGLISQLPDELEKTARLRMEYKDLSISQLASLFTPRISKPGLSHRLKKITELATSILEEKSSKNKK